MSLSDKIKAIELELNALVGGRYNKKFILIGKLQAYRDVLSALKEVEGVFDYAIELNPKSDVIKILKNDVLELFGGEKTWVLVKD